MRAPAPTEAAGGFLESLGPLALALRLRRLSERLVEGGRRFYGARGVSLSPHWYALLLLLDERRTCSVTEAATLLGISHPAMIAVGKRMTDAGLVVSQADPADGRRRLLGLTDRAREELPAFRELWSAFGGALQELLDEVDPSLLGSIGSLENALRERPLDTRVTRHQRASPRVRKKPLPTRIRPYASADRESVLRLARDLVESADTYAFDPAIGDDALLAYWAPGAPAHTSVATHRRRVQGVFVIRPNHPGPGAHIANASYAVSSSTRGRGVGRAMAERSLEIATDLGYAAMQLNVVVASNRAAVQLWRALGFRILGVTPEGFTLPDGRRVDTYTMHRSLR